MLSSYNTPLAKISSSKAVRKQIGFPESKSDRSSSFFEVVVPGEALVKQQQQHQQRQQQTAQDIQNKGIFYRTLESVSNSQYFVCGSINSVVDDESAQPYSPQRYNNLIRCGRQRAASEDEVIDYELDDKDYEDILLRINTATSNISNNHKCPSSPRSVHSRGSSKSPKKKKTVAKRGRLKIRKSPTKSPKRANSLYRKTMMTAATANEIPGEEAQQQQQQQPDAIQQQLKKTARFAGGFAIDAGRAIGNLLPTASLQNIAARKYTLPDKTVASQVLMYRQLLHTKCRPGLKLSRPYQETPAQKAVMHMPWWEQGIEESKKMIISYDNLVTRLWLNGAIEPYQQKGDDLLNPSPETVETYITDEGLPPIPHQFWVDRLGFQQPDPVTDFRSGGVLSLAMMVYMVESKPEICQRFFTGDTKVLPFGITCINVADMIAKFLMLAKSTDRMDALLSQKPFWKMFADPNAITAVQELAMSMLCDVASEVGEEKKIPYLLRQQNEDNIGDARTEVRCVRMRTYHFLFWIV